MNGRVMALAIACLSCGARRWRAAFADAAEGGTSVIEKRSSAVGSRDGRNGAKNR